MLSVEQVVFAAPFVYVHNGVLRPKLAVRMVAFLPRMGAIVKHHISFCVVVLIKTQSLRL